MTQRMEISKAELAALEATRVTASNVGGDDE